MKNYFQKSLKMFQLPFYYWFITSSTLPQKNINSSSLNPSIYFYSLIISKIFFLSLNPQVMRQRQKSFNPHTFNVVNIITRYLSYIEIILDIEKKSSKSYSYTYRYTVHVWILIEWTSYEKKEKNIEIIPGETRITLMSIW